MSATPLVENVGIYSYDFTIAGDKAYGADSQTEVSPGVWAMISGDGNSNGQINIDDKNNVWSVTVGQAGYLQADFNMDGQVDNQDKAEYWIINNGSNCKVPN